MRTTHISEPTEPNAKSKDGQLLETISLRDYFAAKAMEAFIRTAQHGTAFGKDYPGTNSQYANAAYTMADAMLKAREP